MITKTLDIRVLEELSDSMTIDQLVDHITKVVEDAEDMALIEIGAANTADEDPEN